MQLLLTMLVRYSMNPGNDGTRRSCSQVPVIARSAPHAAHTTHKLADHEGVEGHMHGVQTETAGCMPAPSIFSLAYVYAPSLRFLKMPSRSSITSSSSSAHIHAHIRDLFMQLSSMIDMCDDSAGWLRAVHIYHSNRMQPHQCRRS